MRESFKLSFKMDKQEPTADSKDSCSQSSSPGDIALIELQHAILSGREAEVAATMGTGPQEIRRRKDESVRAIAASLEALQTSGTSRYENHRVWAEYWRGRLEEKA